MKYGSILKKIRREKEISQVELAKKIGTTQRTISRWEHGHGKISAERLEIIANSLDVDIQLFFNNTAIDEN